jgi:Beta/Gamma crystallin
MLVKNITGGLAGAFCQESFMASKHKRSLRLLAGALAVVSAGALAGEITLFQNRDFRGNATTLQSPMLDMERNGFTTASSAVVRSGVWQACTNANFQGQCVQLQPGQYRDVNALLSDDVASVREISTASAVPAPVIVASTEPRIALFELPGFNGRSLELSKTMGGLDRSGVYAGADAAVVYGGVWRLCSRQYFRGECADFTPGRYENLGSLTGRVSSAELVAVAATAPVSIAPPPVVTGRVVLYEQPNFRGDSVVINRSVISNLQRVGFNDRAASMVIESGTWMFCTDAGFRGSCYTLGAGHYASLPRDVDRRIASARRVDEVYGSL